MEMLDHRGLLERFSAGTVAPPFVNFGMFPLDLRTLDFPHPHGLFIGQARVEELLEDHVNEVGTEIRRGHEVTDVSQDIDGVTVEVRGPSGGYEIRASYLIGCDGGHSIVRKRAGFSFPGMEPSLVGRMGDIRVAPAGLELLKRAVPQLGGKDFGIVRTETGNFAIVPLGAGIHRVAAVEWDPAPIERDAPMSLDELRAAIRRVTGIDLPMSDPVWLSRPRDRSRLVDRYRNGRVLLAGDAAHIHWAYGGMGLQTGLQDAGNLGWKLAAEVQGWAPKGLLDTYHSERHPVGQRLLMSTRAQEALARPGDHVTALRDLFTELLEQENTRRHIVEMVTGVEIHYDMSPGQETRHPLIGRWAPDLQLITKNGRTRVAELMHRGRGVFLELTPLDNLHSIAAGWKERIDLVIGQSDRPSLDVETLLIRPDGYVAWATSPTDLDEDSRISLRSALTTWFGESLSGGPQSIK
jgi:2-polyprenyl-6-methoxyphenol hydroxylase-like FAD-dependent oxidoreductase